MLGELRAHWTVARRRWRLWVAKAQDREAQRRLAGGGGVRLAKWLALGAVIALACATWCPVKLGGVVWVAVGGVLAAGWRDHLRDMRAWGDPEKASRMADRRAWSLKKARARQEASELEPATRGAARRSKPRRL